MSDLIGTMDISERLNLEHAYVRDRVVKRPDFPRPALALSQKCKRWRQEDFEEWLKKQAKKQAR
ncbi:hypothetical protein ABL840_08940 [Variovorax sp. NFACC27]|uniref:hypothetical protein n=1 Tax=unclassified Variovorax TaxID=663243 RepID=UPI00089D0610|nr:hypothetical protein SAMN03159371_05303 [Variovorax sp. NFACC28]SEG89541.1 hypothetical protein SAMN03159365_05144 [Variovorax sp. NFACC29]SFD40961.1 hypothetical protein SAMN03159379_05193 [Variovorax sp. NFACC26]SFG43071.1 hypothetical protein SAMN03159447_03303 [Variovorax sp. NFACC27]